jgi:hypothetical protein
MRACFFLQAGFLSIVWWEKLAVGKGGCQITWLEGRMGEMLDIGWEGHQGWAVLHVFLLLFYLE